MRIHVDFAEQDAVFPVDFSEENDEFAVEFQDLYLTERSAAQFDGPYSVTPMVSGQTLETKDKFMRGNVEVTAIPFYQVSNPSGGSTIFIGNEV